MRRTAAVTAVLIAAGLLAPATTAQAAQAQAAKPAWKVSATVKSATVVAGEDTVVVRGRVKPNARGQKVVLQQRLEKQTTWHKSGVARIKRNGTYKLTDKPEEGGMREYRVLKPGTDGRRKAVSRTLAVTVYAWHLLSPAFDGPHPEVDNFGYVKIGTRDYSFSLVQTRPGVAGFSEFTLGRLCTSLEATYALTDSSESGSTGSVQVTTDGTVRSTTALAVGAIATTTLDLTGVYRLRFDLSSSETPQGYAAVAAPRVLCAK